MRLAIIVVLGALLGACAESATKVIDADNAEELKPSAEPSVETPAQDPAIEATEATSLANVNACHIQEGEELRLAPVRATGTEPFWSAQVEGRCVTYSTPEDQAGTRIWTHVDTGPQGPVWNGALEGRQFQLTVKPSTGCSDGMSDKTYPMEAVLRVRGETRRGCAEPL